jgi:hypothetical protein
MNYLGSVECAYLSSTTVTDKDELESGDFFGHVEKPTIYEKIEGDELERSCREKGRVADFKGRGERRGMNNNAVMEFLPRRC